MFGVIHPNSLYIPLVASVLVKHPSVNHQRVIAETLATLVAYDTDTDEIHIHYYSI